MPDQDFDPDHFFDRFPRFVDTSETGQLADRLNARYRVLIHQNRELLAGARVVDLASHDGRFTFGALQNGAAHVVGIELEPHLVRVSQENLEHYGAARERYDFVLGDMFDRLDEIDGCDVVFCFGILYHINEHMLLLAKLANLDPRAVIFDTNVAHGDRAVIELRDPFAGSAPPPGSDLEGWPSRSALDAMSSSFGWDIEYFDWPGSGLTDSKRMQDYRNGTRVTAVATSNEHRFAADVREQAVNAVLAASRIRSGQSVVIHQVAADFGTTPQMLSNWIRRADRRKRGNG